MCTPSRARQQHEEAFLGLLRQQSKVTKKPSLPTMGDAPAPLRAGTPLTRRQSIPPLVKTAESLPTGRVRGLMKMSYKHREVLSLNCFFMTLHEASIQEIFPSAEDVGFTGDLQLGSRENLAYHALGFDPDHHNCSLEWRQKKE